MCAGSRDSVSPSKSKRDNERRNDVDSETIRPEPGPDEASLRALQIQELASEWMDLESRLDSMVSQKKAFLAEYKKKSEEILGRIYQLKQEIHAVKCGEALPEPTKQLEFF
jgi:hypothetical protein